jgi:phosphonopyruvate decarboxylase
MELSNMLDLSRYQVLDLIWNFFRNNPAYFTTTGFTSREFSLLVDSKTRFFPCVGGMGYVSSIGFSYARTSSQKTICFDGDGSFMMHLGAIFNVKNHSSVPFLHILINNEVHQSVGGFDIVAKDVDYAALSQAAGYAVSTKILSVEHLLTSISNFNDNPKTTFLHIKVNNNFTNNLPRITGFSKLIERFVKINDV